MSHAEASHCKGPEGEHVRCVCRAARRPMWQEEAKYGENEEEMRPGT